MGSRVLGIRLSSFLQHCTLHSPALQSWTRVFSLNTAEWFWIHYGLTLSSREWKIDDVTMMLVVTQQRGRKNTRLGTCLSIPHTLKCPVLPHSVLGTALRSLWLCYHEKQIVKLLFYNKLSPSHLSKDELKLWQREAAGAVAWAGAPLRVCFFLIKQSLLPSLWYSIPNPDPWGPWQAMIALQDEDSEVPFLRSESSC